jgi:hypothetical protein
MCSSVAAAAADEYNCAFLSFSQRLFILTETGG